MNAVIFYDSIDSTNTELSRRLDGAVKAGIEYGNFHKDIIWTQKQTAGKGRLGRAFFSPESGAYMSFVYCPDSASTENKIFDPAVYTAGAAVAVCRAVKKLYNKNCSVKWVNDIYLGSKKVCGILAEGKLDFQKGQIGALIVGIGINIFTPKESFPLEIQERAGSLFLSREEMEEKGTDSVEILVREICNECFRLYDNAGLMKEAMKEYQSRSNLIGKTVTVTPVIEQESGRYEALVTGITEDARLVVQTPEGRKLELSSGEVTLHV